MVIEEGKFTRFLTKTGVVDRPGFQMCRRQLWFIDFVVIGEVHVYLTNLCYMFISGLKKQKLAAV